MDGLPPSLVLEILSRLTDSADLARCRVASKTLKDLSYEGRTLNHLCTLSQYLKSRSSDADPLIMPFKTIFKNLVRNSPRLECVSIGVEKSLGRRSFVEVEDDYDDLYLSDVSFMKDWLPVIGGRLRSLSISDCWSQSSWRRSDALALISSCCSSLVELELKNTWLSVDGLNIMPKLTNLTLEFVRLDDEDLNKVNCCFMGLQVLNLIGVGGLKEPKIELLHLKRFHWTVSNAPLSLIILAPNLVELKLECIKPKLLVLDTPSLSDLHLTIEEANEFKIKEFGCLKCLKLVSLNPFSVTGMLRLSRTVKMLTVDIPRSIDSVASKLSLGTLFDCFPNLRSLKLGSGAWSGMEALFCAGGLEGGIGMKSVKEITTYLMLYEMVTTLAFLFCVLDRCTNLSDVSLLIHREVDSSTASKFISKCRANWPGVRWRWGMWEEGTEDIWVSDAC
ncbi:hypothetical protein UlMin_022647 [Ulmus minor]